MACACARAELNEREAALTQKAAEVEAAVADVARRRVAEDREMAAQREAVCGALHLTDSNIFTCFVLHYTGGFF